ncbi:hypothetical protein BBJ41_29710 [Burkholderia stabilis]|uniref:hypothetical protein n=1 Tax=Burkholderia stabilis TaxID=95485 RepID=UPI00085200A1|nr:hypothetical protein [Burkholderia stabilis]AOR71628.1 hypothetical protein BBJ41_29710 [Burkholderia stabilis]HDR9491584.1 hypothetical protein [Burkholderia stabilis]HDR9522205.1 hypothetical protein [Burkholderia stabilis]HDR9529454.1 hypothetical protein [Burkholderia stabilis]HDR9539035.1 hypothetical protein [Burkholderia stabilis]
MRLITAALLGAAAIVPSLAPAQTLFPDPADAAATVPDVTVTSAFDGYRPYRDDEGPGWKQLNRDVMARPAKRDAKPGNTTGHGGVHSTHGGAAR